MAVSPGLGWHARKAATGDRSYLDFAVEHWWQTASATISISAHSSASCTFSIFLPTKPTQPQNLFPHASPNSWLVSPSLRPSREQ